MIRKIFIMSLFVMISTISFAVQQSSTSMDPQTIPNVEHVQYWMKTLEANPYVIIRKQAARQLGNLQSNIAVPSLIKGLSDVNDDVRIQSAYALGRIGDSGSLKPLYELIEVNSNSQVKTAARNAIDKINAHEEFVRQRKEKFKNTDNQSSN